MAAVAFAARTLAPAARAWLGRTHRARVLHVFERAVNLVNDQRDVLALVTPGVGPGPFAVVVDAPGEIFTRWITRESDVTLEQDRLLVGSVVMHWGGAALWNPCPCWLHLQKKTSVVLALQGTLHECLCRGAPPDSLAALFKGGEFGDPGGALFPSRLPRAITRPAQTLCAAVVSGDLAACRAGACGLAGLGVGLTPAGDDFLLGAIYAAWSMLPPERATAIAAALADTACPLTTPLSAAWLRAAVRGEAGAPWHSLVGALLDGDEAMTRRAVAHILHTGHTSGADALAGFLAVIGQYPESGQYVLS